MSDFGRLNDPARTILQIKLDGHVEACVHAAHSQCIGMTEALSLVAVAVMRAFAARGLDRTATTAILDAASSQTHPLPAAERPRRLS
jgi:hypothetical protein